MDNAMIYTEIAAEKANNFSQQVVGKNETKIKKEKKLAKSKANFYE